MKDDNDHIKYSADYLMKYLNGELTDKEMQALEKDALEDPFLSDTIEGLEVARDQSVSFESGVADLQKRLTERVREQNRKKALVFMFTRWQVAASFLILAALTTLTITLLKYNGTPKPIALVTQKDTQQISAPSPSALVQTDNDTNKPKAKSSASEPVTQIGDQGKKIRLRQQQEEGTIVSHETEKKPDSTDYAQDFIADDSDKAVASAPSRSSNQEKNIVTDTNKYSKQLDEVVVTGYGAVKRKDVSGFAATVTAKTVQPGGWPALIDYINKNKKINSADSVLKGEEIISFELNKKGKLSSFKVINSISASHDAEVIRLIKSGPALKLSDGKKQKCQVSILFN